MCFLLFYSPRSFLLIIIWDILLDLVIIALFSCLVINGPWFPQIIFPSRGPCLSNMTWKLLKMFNTCHYCFCTFFLKPFHGPDILKNVWQQIFLSFLYYTFFRWNSFEMWSKKYTSIITLLLKLYVLFVRNASMEVRGKDFKYAFRDFNCYKFSFFS